MFEPTDEAVPITEAFFQSHDVSHFAEDGEWMDTAQNTIARGRAQIAREIRRWYDEDFCEAHDEPLNLIVTDDTVVAEWIFHGKPCPPPGGTEVTVPIIAVFEVHERAIRRVRLYYDLAQRLNSHA